MTALFLLSTLAGCRSDGALPEGAAVEHATAPPVLPQLPLEQPTAAATDRDLCTLDREGWLTCTVLSGGPRDLPPEGRFVDIAADESVLCALTPEGEPRCWGRRTTAVDAREFESQHARKSFVALSAGEYGMCGIRANGKVYCMGRSAQAARVIASGDTWLLDERGHLSQLGFSATEVDVEGAFVDMASDHDVTCGLRTNGTLTCWGDRWSGPRQIPGPWQDPIVVSGVVPQVCALDASGSVHCHHGDGTTTTHDFRAGAVALIQRSKYGACAVHGARDVTCFVGRSRTKVAFDTAVTSQPDDPARAEVVPPATPAEPGAECRKYTACVCAVSRLIPGLVGECDQARRRVTRPELDDPGTCRAGLTLHRQLVAEMGGDVPSECQD